LSEDSSTIVIGAMTRHSDVLEDPLVRQHAGLLVEATATVADPAVRQPADLRRRARARRPGR
jgi:carbon-monoxide dehydrogenase medium subunit